MRAMGLKDRAKALMQRAGVPVVPGYHGESQDPRVLLAAAEDVGFPVLIKAVAGGGGKGMRRVDDAAGFSEALAAARREAESAFGDDRVLVEKYVAAPRHIELQVFGDRHGHALVLNERDCSLQRRHQKVLEEAPAPGMTQETRAALQEVAAKAVRAIGYEGAGTIEMIADGSRGLRAERLYFMEMNTRLQVEHPVTEFITGFDLVEWQLRVAWGEALPITQAQVPLRGHAIEVRLYAEDPAHGYLPQTGVLGRLRFPAAAEGLRIDTGVREGDAVSLHYDPMLAKIIAHAPTRDAARTLLVRALGAIEVAGLATNLGFLRRVVAHEAFARGEVHTAFLEQHAAAVCAPGPARERELRALAAVCIRFAQLTAAGAHPFAVDDGFQPWAKAEHVLRLDIRGREEVLRLTEGPLLSVHFTDGAALQLADAALRDGCLSATLDGRRISARLHAERSSFWLLAEGDVLHFSFARAGGGAEARPGELDAIRAPMPGKVTAVHTAAGALVRRGDPLVRLEAMKMEHTLRAPEDAVVLQVSVREGAQVTEGSVLVSLRAKEE
jgi:3-methylcrotonyl-CoA carboxylase alpha subunit